jgi:hypothetical protein
VSGDHPQNAMGTNQDNLVRQHQGVKTSYQPGELGERNPNRRSRRVYLRKKPIDALWGIPGIRSWRATQHWAIQVGEGDYIWDLDRLTKREMKEGKLESNIKFSISEWDEEIVKKWGKEYVGETTKTDAEIIAIGKLLNDISTSTVLLRLIRLFPLQLHKRSKR